MTGVLQTVARCGALLALTAVAQGCQVASRTLPTGATPTPPEPVDLWEAYQVAYDVAQEEGEEAHLVSASAQWQAVSTPDTLLEGTPRWSFQFYSEEEATILDVVVSADSAQLLNRTRVWNAPTVLPDGDWRDGPGRALLGFLANGGQAFLHEHPQALVDLHLGQDEQGGSTWSLVALDTSDRSVLAMHIDVDTTRVWLASP
jgi:hypothetical protein